VNKKQKLKNTLYKGVKVVSEVAEVAVHVKSNSRIANSVLVLSKVLDAGIRIFKKDDSEYFNDWESMSLSPLDGYMFHLLDSNNLFNLENPDSTEEPKIVVADLGDFKIGWSVYSSWKDGPFVYPPSQKGEAKKYLAELTWKCVNNRGKIRIPFGSPCVVLPDSITDVLPSKLGDDIWNDKIKMFLEKGFGRSILLFGEPGTGKSFMIRHIASQAGGRSLRVRARDMSDSNMLGEIIDLLRPDAILIDDLDRALNPSEILEEFDEMKVREGLILATANELEWMDAATVRRFNTLEEIKSLDEEILDKLLQNIDEEARKELEKLPITYIDEYSKICKVMGRDVANESVKHLVHHRNTVLSILDRLDSNEENPEESKKKKKRSKSKNKKKKSQKVGTVEATPSYPKYG